MQKSRILKVIMERSIRGRESKGRSAIKWQIEVDKDLRVAKVAKWKEKVL